MREKRKRKIRKRGMAAVLLLCMALGSLQASAADDQLGTVVDGSLLTEETEVESVVYPLARYSYLATGTGTLTLTGTRTVRMTGSTTATSSVDRIKVQMYLQRLKNGTWVNYQTGTLGIKYNTYYVSTTDTITVEGGYYYRACGAHAATEGSTTDSTSSYTDGMWIN
ncbi:MAG: DUF6147 family protein [Lachnospiraceae bacterium]|nr:DUF6147 family protein [Lachnospiraceae bacterium]